MVRGTHSQCFGVQENQPLWGLRFRMYLHLFKISHARHRDPCLCSSEPIGTTAQWGWCNQGHLLGSQASEGLNDSLMVCDATLCVPSRNNVFLIFLFFCYVTCAVIFPDILLLCVLIVTESSLGSVRPTRPTGVLRTPGHHLPALQEGIFAYTSPTIVVFASNRHWHFQWGNNCILMNKEVGDLLNNLNSG